MKRIILSLTVIIFSSNINAQTGTNLQFNQTITECISKEDTCVQIGIVPAGKIWKVVGHSITQEEWDLSPGMGYDKGALEIANFNTCDLSIIWPVPNYIWSTLRQGIATAPYDNQTGTDYSQIRYQFHNAELPIYFNENEEFWMRTGGSFLIGCVSIVEYTVIP